MRKVTRPSGRISGDWTLAAASMPPVVLGDVVPASWAKIGVQKSTGRTIHRTSLARMNFIIKLQGYCKATEF
jgi:hypothetical protein